MTSGLQSLTNADILNYHRHNGGKPTQFSVKVYQSFWFMSHC